MRDQNQEQTVEVTQHPGIPAQVCFLETRTSFKFLFLIECYESFKESYKHYTYRDYKTSSSVAGCADECKRTSWCNSISYRYSYNSATDIGNCLLSDTRVEDLRDPEDLVKVIDDLRFYLF